MRRARRISAERSVGWANELGLSRVRVREAKHYTKKIGRGL
jgi:hypothetical protein